MFKNKSPYSHTQSPHQAHHQSQHQQGNYMFGQTLAAQVGNKNRIVNVNSNGHTNTNMNNNGNGSISPNNGGGFTGLFRKVSGVGIVSGVGNISNISNTSNTSHVDIDLGCDEVLIKNPTEPSQADIDFTCNQSLIPVTRPVPLLSPSSLLPPRNPQPRRHPSSQIPLVDLKCNEDLFSLTDNQKQNRESPELEDVRRRVESVLEYYQRLVLHQQEKIYKLEAERENLLVMRGVGK